MLTARDFLISSVDHWSNLTFGIQLIMYESIMYFQHPCRSSSRFCVLCFFRCSRSDLSLALEDCMAVLDLFLGNHFEEAQDRLKCR